MALAAEPDLQASSLVWLLVHRICRSDNVVFRTTGETTMKSISATEANRKFSALLRAVSRGAQITVTSRGKPVATITPAEQVERQERAAAHRSLLARLRKRKASGRRTWARAELYD